MPDEPEATALLALMLFHHARRAGRTNAAGEVITLEDQDRSLWDQAQISEGTVLLEAARQAAAAGPVPDPGRDRAVPCHRADGRPDRLAVISRLYGMLAVLVPSAVVELNRAVAVGMADGPAAGLVLVDELTSPAGSRATTCSRRPGPTCSAASAARPRRRTATARRSTSPLTKPSAATWRAASPRRRAGVAAPACLKIGASY